jgi:membrane fusion protein (multidrug efflux system)
MAAGSARGLLRLNRHKIGVVRALLPALLALAVVACGRRDPPPPEAETTAVTVQPARLETLREVLTLPGTVVPSAMADFTVIAPESSEIAELPKPEGSAVKEGDVLVRFEIPTLSTNLLARQTDVGEATARVESARAELARLTGLLEKGIIPRNSVESARTALASAEAALGQAKASLDSARMMTERTIVRSRFAGTVTKVFHKAGDTVLPDSGDPILRVIDPTRTQVAIQAPVAQVDRLTPGRSAVVATAAGTTQPASVSSRLAAPPGAATAEVRLSFNAPSALPLDSIVQVEIQLDERKDVLVVPEQAVVRDGTAAHVWIAREDSRAERRLVRVGLTVNRLSQILSGVQAGERVITTGLAQLQDGSPIVVSR